MIKKLTVALVLLLAAVFSAASELSDLQKELKGALAAKDKAQVLAISQQLCAMGKKEAVELVARYALLVDSYNIERKLAGLLAGLPEELREPVRKLALKHPRYEARIVLAAVLAAYRDEKSFKTLCAMLRDRVPSVKLAVISHLVKLGDVRAIDPLIDELSRWERAGGVVAGDLRQALHVLTGQYFHRASDWKKWWSINRAVFKGPRAARARRGGRTTVRGPTFFGHEIVSKRILFILDMSGSMHVRDPYVPEQTPHVTVAKRGTTAVTKRTKKSAGKAGGKGKGKAEELPRSRERLYRVQQELLRTIDALTPDTRFTVMAFNHKILMLSDTPQLATAAFKRKAKAFVMSFRPEGETWTDKALERAFEMADKIDTIYLLSDGAPRRNNKRLDESVILEAVKRANRFHKIKIYTVGFLQAGRRMRAFLSALARQNGGEYKELR